MGLWHVKSKEGVEASHTSCDPPTLCLAIASGRDDMLADLGNHELPALKCVPSTCDRVFFVSATAVRCGVIIRDGLRRVKVCMA